jgi:hypothetical protein
VWSLAAVAIAAAVGLSTGRHEPGLSLWPTARQWPTDAEVTRGTRLDDLWQALRAAPPGRILFVRSSVPLEYRPEWWRPHSHITALAPVRAGRAIVGGTFTHPSPVAGFVYSGSAVAPIALLAEQRDGLTLFGAPLGELPPAEVVRLAEALRLSAVVALDEDAPHLTALGAATGFAAPRRIGPFLYYVALAPRPLPEVVGDGHLRLPAGAGAPWRDAGIAYSPLWLAQGSDGRALGTRRGLAGLLEVEGFGSGAIDLIYRPGLVEWVGLALSVAAAAAGIVTAARGRRARRSA